MPVDNNKIKNERIVPTDLQFLSDNKVDFKVYAKMQLESFWNKDREEEHRYVYKNSFSPKALQEEINLNEKTIRGKIKHLIEIGYVRQIKDTRGKIVYLLPNNGYTHYSKIPYEELKFLCECDDIDSNAIKIYTIIKGFTEDKNGFQKCFMSRETIADKIGISSKAHKNVLKVGKYIELLERLGLIETEKVTIVENGATKTLVYKWCKNRNKDYHKT